MHDECRDWIVEAVGRYGPFGSVLDLGGRDVNGTIRDLFPGAAYAVVDKVEGPNVDVVADATVWRPDSLFDAVVCSNVFEHVEAWRAIVITAALALRPGGIAVLTTVGPAFPPHSGIDGCELRVGEWYSAVTFDELDAAVGVAGLEVIDSLRGSDMDSQVVARKPAT